MSEDRGPFIFALAGEDDDHHRVVTLLVDRVLCESVDWLDEELLPYLRRWQGRDSKQEYYKHIYERADSRSLRAGTWGSGVEGISIHGFIDGRPQLPEAAHFRKLLLIFMAVTERPDAVVMVRDGDERRRGRRLRAAFEQVRQGYAWPFALVLALPEPEIQAWEIAAFLPGNSEEEALLAEVRTLLGFDPVREPHRLTAQPNTAQTDAKRVRQHLLGIEVSGADIGLRRSLDELRATAPQCGLPAFLEEVAQYLAPIFLRAR